MNAAEKITQDKLDAEKSAVKSMQKAQANMTHALTRIRTLERALKTLIEDATDAAKHISNEGYIYNSAKTCRSDFLGKVRDASEHLK